MGAWDDCFALIDPELRQQGKVNLGIYADLMKSFKEAYGSINTRWTDLSVHLEASPKQKDKRPFGYVYVLWQDDAHEFHLFRERWVQDDGRWFTRVVGLVPNRRPVNSRHA
jgi:hypothetical protein